MILDIFLILMFLITVFSLSYGFYMMKKGRQARKPDEIILAEALDETQIYWDEGWHDYTVRFLARRNMEGKVELYALTVEKGDEA